MKTKLLKKVRKNYRLYKKDNRYIVNFRARKGIYWQWYYDNYYVDFSEALSCYHEHMNTELRLIGYKKNLILP